MLLRQIFDPRLAQYAYLIGCQETNEALIIDPERDVDRYLELARAEDLEIRAAAETHIHADFLSGARELAERAGVKLFLSGEGGPDGRYEWPRHSHYDCRFLRDGDTFTIGKIEILARHTPGHTPEHLCFIVTDRGAGADRPIGIASGDFVFVGDVGRPDLLESAAGQVGARRPAAEQLYRSLHGVLELPDYLQVWPGHGAGSACGKALGSVPVSSIGYERRYNPALQAVQVGRDAFVDAILEGQPEPPLYFARMKTLNREGPPLLGDLPRPRSLRTEELRALADRNDVVVVDTRADRQAFMAAHLPGAIYAPLDRTFPTITGSYVEPGVPIYLILEPGEVDEAVRALVRIGLDQVAGFATPETLARHKAAGGAIATIETIDFATVRSRMAQPDTTVLDVRGLSEYGAGHVPGALNIAHTRLLARRSELPAGHTLLVHCRRGARAASAASVLERCGARVVYVRDRFEAWQALEAASKG